MARIDRNADRFLTKLGADLKSDPLSPEQVTQLSNAVAALPAKSRLTAKEIDTIAKELGLPNPHKATLIFALFFQKYGALVTDELQNERVLAKGLSSALTALIDRSRKKDGENVAVALEEFFQAYAGPTASIENTGVELYLGAAPKLAVENDRIRLLGKAATPRWQNAEIHLTAGTKSGGELTFDDDRGFLFRNAPLDRFGPNTLRCLYSALANMRSGQASRLENIAVEKAFSAVSEVMSEATQGREVLDRGNPIEGSISIPDPKAAQDVGAFVQGGEGGWAFKRSKTDVIPLGRLSIDSLQSLSTALSNTIRAPKVKQQKNDAKQAIALARTVSFVGELLTEVARTLDRKIKEEQTQRAESEAALRVLLKDYRVAHIGAESLNALVHAFAGQQQS